jgi:hypothetical protein
MGCGAGDPATLLPILRMLRDSGGNEGLAVFYSDPPDKWRVRKVALDLIIERLGPAIRPTG